MSISFPLRARAEAAAPPRSIAIPRAWPWRVGVTEPGIVLVLTTLGIAAPAASAIALLNRLVNYASLAVAAGAVSVLPRPRGTTMQNLEFA